MRVYNRLAAISAGMMLAILVGKTYADDQTSYKIQLDRPSRVGDRCRLERTAVDNIHYVLRDGDRIIKDDDRLMGAKIVADAKVLAVDEGTANRIAYTIQALFSYDGKTDKELLPAGTVIVAEAGEPAAKFSVDDKPVSADLLRAMGFLIHPRTHRNAIPFDKLFGTTGPRKVGDTWQLDSKSVAELVSRAMPTTEASSNAAHGQATLVSIEPSDTVQCIRINIDVRADDLKFKSPMSQPVRSGFSGGDVSLHYIEDVPIDPTSLAGDGSYSSVRHYIGQFRNGDRLEDFEETIRSEADTKTTP